MIDTRELTLVSLEAITCRILMKEFFLPPRKLHVDPHEGILFAPQGDYTMGPHEGILFILRGDYMMDPYEGILSSP